MKNKSWLSIEKSIMKCEKMSCNKKKCFWVCVGLKFVQAIKFVVVVKTFQII